MSNDAKSGRAAGRRAGEKSKEKKELLRMQQDLALGTAGTKDRQTDGLNDWYCRVVRWPM